MEEGWRNIGRFLMVTGGVLVVVGGILYWLGSRGWPRLPGDIVIARPGYSIYVPIGTSVVVSLLLTLIFWLIRRWGGGGSF